MRRARRNLTGTPRPAPRAPRAARIRAAAHANLPYHEALRLIKSDTQLQSGANGSPNTDPSRAPQASAPAPANDYAPLPEPSPEISIGGQAVLEGVMMRGPRSYAVAVRRAQGDIVMLSRPFAPITKRHKILGLPVVRGAVSLIEMLFLGYRTLEYSAGIAEQSLRENDATESPAKALAAADSMVGALSTLPANDSAPAASASQRKPGVLTGWHMLLIFLVSMSFAMLLFVVLPNVSAVFISGRKEQNIPITFNLIAGCVRILIMIGYIWGISHLKDIGRLFQYHGAEHKVVMAYEQRIPLELDRLRPVTTVHPRCGTTFIAIVIFVSIVAFAFLAALVKIAYPPFQEWTLLPQKALIIGLHILFMPLVAGLAFEITRRAGRRPDFWLYHLLLLPGYAFQRITTREPDDSMLEVAVAAFREALVPRHLESDAA
jgi:uncharacterized protein YqhQ